MPTSKHRCGRLAGFRHPGVAVGVALVGLGLSFVLAIAEPVPTLELDLTEWINVAPDAVATVLYPIMQAGTLAGPIVVAVAIAVVCRDRWLSVATVGSGIATWFAAKGIKRIVERGRPGAFLPEIDIREGSGTGLGYVSGHSAVAACAAVMAMAAIPPRWRPAAAGVAGLVGIARIVHGVHLPADVVGGWSFGALFAFATLAFLDRVESQGAESQGAEPQRRPTSEETR